MGARRRRGFSRAAARHGVTTKFHGFFGNLRLATPFGLHFILFGHVIFSFFDLRLMRVELGGGKSQIVTTGGSCKSPRNLIFFPTCGSRKSINLHTCNTSSSVASVVFADLRLPQVGKMEKYFNFSRGLVVTLWRAAAEAPSLPRARVRSCHNGDRVVCAHGLSWFRNDACVRDNASSLCALRCGLLVCDPWQLPRATHIALSTNFS